MLDALLKVTGSAKSDKLRRVWTRGLARWYEMHGRHDLPWRATAEPWAILVSEVMLQQTQVARVAGRWESFLARWPTPEACAAAPLAAVLREWQGLGYPRRARALHDTARSRRRRRLAGHRGRPAHRFPASARTRRAHCGSSRSERRRFRRRTSTSPGSRPGRRSAASRGEVRRRVHRRAACDRAAPRNERARLHIRAVRRRRAALQSAPALPGLPARRNLRVP